MILTSNLLRLRAGMPVKLEARGGGWPAMTLSETCIQRPVLAVVLSLLILLFGLVSLPFLGVREYPAVDPPIVTVNTGYRGAARLRRGPRDHRAAGAGHQRRGRRARHHLHLPGGPEPHPVEFNLDSDLEAAANDVRDKVSQSVRLLPPDADPPVVDKADADSEPVMMMLLRSDTRPLLELNAFAQNVVEPQIQTIPGVAAVRIWGEKRYAMRL